MKLIKDNYKIEIDENRGSITSLNYCGKEYIGGEMPLFEIALRDKEGELTKCDTNEFLCVTKEENEDFLSIVFKSDRTTVRTKIEAKENLSFYISIDGISDKVTEWVKYPQIAVPDDFSDNGGSSKVLWGFNEGTLIENMTDREKGIPYFEPEYPCKGIMGVFPAIVETQYMAYYNSESGMYIASHDSKNHLKAINIYRNAGGVQLEFRHFTGCEFGADYSMPYPMVIEFFKGDWHDAAEIYKKWFKAQSGHDFIKISKNKKIPDWYKESPVVITYPVRGKHDTDIMNPNKLFPYINVLPHVERFEKEFNSKIMILLMQWEGTAPWAPPIVWPPYGGEACLKKLIDALHERGDILGVYCSGLGWTISSKLEDYKTYEFFEENNLKDEMCLSPKLDLPYSDICTMQRSGYDMCPSREFTKNIVKEQVKHMVGAGIDYIQLMDQNHGGTSYFCYSREHSHPPVPGKWQVDAVKELLSGINKFTGQVLLGCESAAAESYIPNLLFSDNRFNLAYYIGRPVPAYSYIYHEYVNNFLGNQVCVDWHIDYNKSPEAFFERIGYSFSAGDMLTAVITEDGEIDWNWGKKDREKELPNQENAKTLIRNLNFWRMSEKEFLNTGSMVKPIAVGCDKLTIWRNNKSKTQIPKVHTSAWLSQNRDFAQFLVNYNESVEVAMVNFDREGYYLCYMDGTQKKLTKGENKIEVPPFSALVIKYQKNS